jgi:membrane protease YdiL (CAAX protease family)
MKKKYTAFGTGIFLLVLTVWFLAVSGVAGLFLGAGMLAGRTASVYGMYAVLGAAELLLAAPLAVYMAIFKISPRALLGNRTNLRQNLSALLFGVLLVPGLMGLEAVVAALFGSIGVVSTDTSFLNPGTPGEMLAGFLAIGITAGLVEEPVFRGVALRGLGSAWGRRAAVLASALAFSLFHLDAVGSIERFLIGVVLGYMTWRAGALLPGMLAHAAFNSTALALGFLSELYLKDWNGFNLLPSLSADVNGILTVLLISLPFAAAAWGAYRLFARATPAASAWGAKPYAADGSKAAGALAWSFMTVVLLALTVALVFMAQGLPGQIPGF